MVLFVRRVSPRRRCWAVTWLATTMSTNHYEGFTSSLSSLWSAGSIQPTRATLTTSATTTRQLVSGMRTSTRYTAFQQQYRRRNHHRLHDIPWGLHRLYTSSFLYKDYQRRHMTTIVHRVPLKRVMELRDQDAKGLAAKIRDDEIDREKEDFINYLLDVMTEKSDSEQDVKDETSENEVIEQRVRKWLEDIVVGLNLCPFAEKAVRGQVKQTSKDVDIFDLYATDVTQLIGAGTKMNPTRPYMKMIVIRRRLKPGSSGKFDEDDEEFILRWVGVELLRLDQLSPGTTLVICPDCHPNDFHAFMNVVNKVEQGLLPALGLEGHIQVAPFHPQFQFEGSEEEEGDGEAEEGSNEPNVDNWTNRSPYPIFHLLREDEVEVAVEKLEGDAGRVWKRNVALLQAIYNEWGVSGLQRLYNLPDSTTQPSSSKGDETRNDVRGDGFNEEEKEKLKSILKEHRVKLKPTMKTPIDDVFEFEEKREVNKDVKKP